jgi:hypothetical protein
MEEDEMSLNKNFNLLLLFTIVFLFIIISGCSINFYTNTTPQRTSLSTIIQTQTLTTQLPVSDSPTISPVSSSGPIFPETNSTVDANGTPILSKSQAWSYAESYLQKRGLINIQPGEVKAYNPHIFIDEDKKQELIWTFEINRTGLYGIQLGGIIFIDAYNGDVLSYAAFT